MTHQKTTKFCRRCERTLPRESFDERPKVDGQSNGLRPLCRECNHTGMAIQRARAVASAPDRFWLKVDRSGGSDACWPFMGQRGEFGHGRFTIAGRGNVGAHRYAWELKHGPIPEGMSVCHTCDNPPCCNPAHHFLGTTADNNYDRYIKGRTNGEGARKRAGEAHEKAKLTAQQVTESRSKYLDTDVSVNQLAKEYGVSSRNMSDIVRGVTWKSIPFPHSTIATEEAARIADKRAKMWKGPR